jgi:hypothetical protein
MSAKLFLLSPHNFGFTRKKASELQLDEHPARPLSGEPCGTCTFTALSGKRSL